MKIYTSNFANLKNLEKDGILPISISRQSPKWYKGIELKRLAPQWDVVRLREDKYTPKFNKTLSEINPKKVIDYFKKLNHKKIALLCYEKKGDFCHRHLVSKWLNDNLDINIEEYDKNKTNQLDIF